MDENAIITGSGNVFADLGLPDPEERQLKAQLAAVIGETIGRLELSQTAAATRLGIAQSDVSNLLRGRLRGYSLERLFGWARRLGNDIEIKVKRPTRTREGRLRMLVA